MKKKFLIGNLSYLLVFSIIITSIFIVLLYGTIQLEKDIEKKMFAIATDDITSISKNTTKSIKKLLENDTTKYIQTIRNNPEIQKNIENKLEILITDNIKYSYLLYKDKKGIFRFLVDGSKEEEKSFIDQKFDIDSTKWMEVYEKKEPILIRHEILKQLSITYIIPILSNSEVEILLAIDYSVKKLDEINEIIELMKKGFSLILIIALMFIIILVIQIIRYRKIKQTAFIDTLTNVYNKNYLEEIKKTIQLENYVLAILDIDYFKKINDTYGHQIGDIVLKKLANILVQNVRTEDDFIIRFGGEEFILLIKNKKEDHEIALTVINRIFENIQKNKFYTSKNNYLNLTASIGINLKPHLAKDFNEAFSLADSALYDAKNSGRNTIKIHEQTNTL